MLLSKQLKELTKRSYTIQELAHALKERGHALVTLVISLPFLFFLPLPGLSILFGFFIMINGFQITAKRDLWIPRFLRNKVIPKETLLKACEKVLRLALRLEKLIKPRAKLLSSCTFCIYLNGIILGICGFILLLPLPPGTNFPPALPVFLLSLGMLEDDGYLIALSYIAFAFCIALFTYLGFIGYREWEALRLL